MKSLDIFELKPASRVLIEASAGTGKTYTIAGVFARFIAEGRYHVDQILVVTYTR
ncbi:MAG: UvrD-helicase domain-containing protein, partial [Balneolaceae bacterium]